MFIDKLISLFRQYHQLSLDELKSFLPSQFSLLKKTLKVLIEEKTLKKVKGIYYLQTADLREVELQMVAPGKAVIEGQLVLLDQKRNYFQGDLVLFNHRTQTVVSVLEHRQKEMVIEYQRPKALYTRFNYLATVDTRAIKLHRFNLYQCAITNYDPLELRPIKHLPSDNYFHYHYQKMLADDGLLVFDTPEVASELASLPKRISDQDLVGRQDYRSLVTFTIDGADSKDRDDAISIVREGEKYRLFVHISDVDHYVPLGSALDIIAQQRTSSIYAPEFVFPMFHHQLSNDLCSLNLGVDRLVLTCEMLVDADGEVESYQFHRGVIRSQMACNYDEVFAYFSGNNRSKHQYHVIGEQLLLGRELALLMEQRFRQRNVINFEENEVEFTLEGKKVLQVQRRQRNFAHKMIEYFMISANVAAAEYLCYLSVDSIYRVHPEMTHQKLATHFPLLKSLGLSFRDHPQRINLKYLQEILDQAGEDPQKYSLASQAILRANEKAIYSDNNLGHFSLNLNHYTHFTSPIRRYADLVVHRLIKGVLSGRIPQIEVHNLSKHLSKQEIAIVNGERKIDKFLKARYMTKHLHKVFVGEVVGVSVKGVHLVVEAVIGVLVRPEDQTDLVVMENEAYFQGRLLKLLDQVLVEIINANYHKGFIDGQIMQVVNP